MAKLYRLRAAAVIMLGLVNEASLISAFKLTFPSLNSTSGATSITWDPQTSSCSFLTIQHQCLPDKYVTTRTSVSEKFKMMPIPVDWLERLIKNGTSHCRAVAQCEDGFPNVSTLASIDVYMASNSKGQPTFSSVDTGSGASSSNSATQPTSTGSTTSPSTSTFVSAPASTTSGASTTDSSSSGGSQAKHSSLGAILGGTLGGLAALLLGIFFLFWRQRRRRSSSEKPLVIETPEPSPQELPPLTPFVPSSPSSPNESFPSPNADGYHIDTNVSPKSRMLAGLSATSSSQSGSSSEALGGATSSERTDSADGEVTRRQIMDLNSRIMQLEATRRESELEAAPPRYSVGS